MRVSRAAAVILMTVLATSVGCTWSPAPEDSGTQPSTSTTMPMPSSSICDDATASAATNRSADVGTRQPPVIGPLSFHPYPYEPGYPTKVLISVIASHTHDIILTGVRCNDGRPLRMWYDNGLLPEPVPLSEEQLQRSGQASVRLTPLTAGHDHTGAMLFSSTGKWAITVTENNSTLGILLIDVTPNR